MIVDTSGKLSAATNLLPEIKLLSCPWLPQPYVWHQPECRYKKTARITFGYQALFSLLKLVFQ